MEKIVNKIFEFFSEGFNRFFNLPVSELTLSEIIFYTGILVILAFLALKLLKVIWAVIKGIFKFIRVTTAASEKCKHIQCLSCGRTLDKCQCQKNKGKSNLSRLIAYKREAKSLRK